MKKFFAIYCIVALGMTLTITSCKEKIKTVRGKVASVENHGDTLISMKVTDGEDSLKFNLDEAQFNNGIMLIGDSVIVNYFNGKDDAYRAAVITVLPRPTQYLDQEIDSTKELKTVSDDKVNKKLEY